jgi:hypothetical protein
MSVPQFSHHHPQITQKGKLTDSLLRILDGFENDSA